MKKRKVWVLGHKNPDTDSVCSAIAYAHLKNQTGTDEYIPVRPGHMSEETHYVLNYFKVPKPKYVTNVQSQVSDIDYRVVEGVDKEISLMKAWDIMRSKDVMTLPILEGERLLGLISLGDIAEAYMDVADNRILSQAKTQYRNIVETLNGEMLVGDINQRFTEGKVLVGAANPDQMEKLIEKNDIVILGNRYEAQLCAIEMGSACIIVTQDAEVSFTIQKLAQEKGCFVITTPYDTYTAARLLNQSMPIEHFMLTTKLTTFLPEDPVEKVKETMAKLRHRYFPVVDKENRYLGLLSKRSLLDMTPKALILVDHNEKSQAVDGIDDAEILEIIDHHRLGSIETMAPVFFRNQPLGCTATIIYLMYKEQHVEIPKQIAGLLCGAILSDTLIFRSPTCTQVDRDAAQELATIAGIDAEKFAIEMFRAGINFAQKTPDEIYKRDLKRFALGERVIEIAQLNFMSEDEIEGLEKRLLEYMRNRISNGGVENIYFMMTDIVHETTKLLFAGAGAAELIEDAFHEPMGESSVILPGMVSRKKQLIPQLMSSLQQ